jgi:DNA-binding PadR family transcriptional regulator
MSQPRIKSAIPRGFSRFYVLFLLKERPMTGREIMEETEKRSNGAWKPSPGLVYPLLGRLLAEGLIVENQGGGYSITDKGSKALEDYTKSAQGFTQVFDTVMRLGVFGKLFAQDVVDRMISLANAMKQDLSRMTSAQRAKYRDFLRSELERIEREEEERKKSSAATAPTSSSPS